MGMRGIPIQVFITKQLEPYTALTVVDASIIYKNTKNQCVIMSINPRWNRLEDIAKYQMFGRVVDMTSTLSDMAGFADTAEIVVDMIVNIDGKDQLITSKFKQPIFTHFSE